MSMRSTSLVVASMCALCACSGSDGGGDGKKSSARDVTADCLLYLACMVVEDPDNSSLYEDTYGEDGECWTAGSSEALACTQECQNGIAAASIADPSESACWPSGLPEAPYLFASAPIWEYSNMEGDCYDMEAMYAASSPGQTFTASFIWQNGFSLGTECTIAVDLTFACDRIDRDGDLRDFSGGFSDTFATSTLADELNGDPHCSYEGVPGV
jgi:hypothetical protein